MGVCYGTPVFPTSYLKSGMKSTISSSSSSAAGNSHDLVGARSNQAFRDGENLAEPNLTVFSFVELKKAIKNFRADLLLGEGGFGYVYKGMLHGRQRSGRTKTVIAVKRLKQHSVQGYGEWPRAPLLIFHGMYELRLQSGLPEASLSCTVLRKKLIHGYFKTSNVLLDESYSAKLADFGLVRSGDQEDGTRTCVYAAPESLACGLLSVKSDVYCFGITLLEILTGLRAYDRGRPAESI